MHIWEYMDDQQETEAPKPYTRLIYGILMKRGPMLTNN
jgi:hypothetical protein